MSKSEKVIALQTVMQYIRKTYGEGSVMSFNQTQTEEVKVISSGSLSLDIALGIGGVPYGRIIEVFGPESSGKTTIALHMIAEAHKVGGTCVFVDTEHAFDPLYAQKIGVSLADDSFILSQPTTAEEALKIVDDFVRSQAVSIIVVDSVAALVPRAELEGEMGDMQMGLHARLMSQALRKLTGVISKCNCIVVFINQIRQKIGVMFGPSETTTGGISLKFYSSIRLDVRRIGSLKKGDEHYGSQVKVKVVKNKMAPPFQSAEFEILYGHEGTFGISKDGEILALGVAMGIIDKSGAWYAYKDKKIGQGKDVARKFLQENPKIAKEIEEQIKQKLCKSSFSEVNNTQENANIIDSDKVTVNMSKSTV